MPGPGKTAMGTDMTMVSLKTGDRLRTLERLRNRLAEEIDVNPSARDLALLGTRLQAVMAEIAELAPTVDEPAADVIAKRREARRRKGQSVSVDHTQQGLGRGHG